MAKASKSFGKNGGNDLRYLAKRMTEYEKAIETGVNKFGQELAVAVVANLAKLTPVDVGTARSNWSVQLGFAGFVRRAAYSPFPSRWKPRPGLHPGGSLGETRNQAGAVWAASGVVKNRAPGQPIYITNNLPYIARLNTGWSKQAPAGFVDTAITIAISQVSDSFSLDLYAGNKSALTDFAKRKFA